MNTIEAQRAHGGAQRPVTADREAVEEDRRNLRRVLDSLVLHLHPTRVPARALRFTATWGLGGISALLALLLGLTGVLLMFRYEPDIDRAYLSILALETEVAFGSLLRALHHWASNLLVITVFLHLVRVVVTGGYKAGRRLNWTVGVGLLLLVLTFNFTGTLLPWDQLAYWAVTVSTSIIHHVPLVGREIAAMLLGGREVGQSALRTFYALHVAALPAVTIALLATHVWRVRKDGGIALPLPGPGERVERVTTVPHLVRREVAVGAVVLTALVAFAMVVPAPLGDVADPLRSPNPAKAAWYFGGLQELLLHMETEAALLLLAILFGALLTLPFLERKEADIGLPFRSARGRQAALWGAVLALNLTPAAILADELWIDWTAWLPTWPTFAANGLLPVGAILATLLLIYLGARTLLKADPSEATVALFTFLTVALIVMTLTCALFRGPNMALTLPSPR